MHTPNHSRGTLRMGIWFRFSEPGLALHLHVNPFFRKETVYVDHFPVSDQRSHPDTHHDFHRNGHAYEVNVQPPQGPEGHLVAVLKRDGEVVEEITAFLVRTRLHHSTRRLALLIAVVAGIWIYATPEASLWWYIPLSGVAGTLVFHSAFSGYFVFRYSRIDEPKASGTS